jgi:hypothetical protein
MDEWPSQSPLAFAWTVTQAGMPTGLGRGLYTRRQWLAGEGRGEYQPVFRGDVARELGYVEGPFRRTCGALSYARMLERGPLYVFPQVMRIYHVETPHSLSKSPLSQAKAKDAYNCFKATREAVTRFDKETGSDSSPYLPDMVFREAVYCMLGQSRSRGVAFAWGWRRTLGWKKLTLVLHIFGSARIYLAALLYLAKRSALLPRFG